jgi:hypothetical protein
MIKVVILFVILVAISGGGYFVYTNPQFLSKVPTTHTNIPATVKTASDEATPKLASPKTATQTAQTPIPSTSYQLYVNNKYGFKMNVPSSWKVEEDKQGVAMFATDTKAQGANLGGNFNVVVIPTQGMNLETIVTEGKKQLSVGLENYKQLEEGKAQVGGKDGYYVIGGFEFSGLKLKNKQLLVVSGSNYYVVTATFQESAWDTNRGLADKVLGSFETIPVVSQTSTSGQTYTNSDYNLTLTLPEGWVESPNKTSQLLAGFTNPAAELSGSTFGIGTIKTEGHDLEYVVNAVKTTLFRTFNQTSDKKVTVNGLEGREIEADYNAGESGIRTRVLFVIKGDNCFIVSAIFNQSIWDKYDSTIESTLQSLKFN